MLSNAYFLAKFHFDTAENEPAKKMQNLLNFANRDLEERELEVRDAELEVRVGAPAEGLEERRGVLGRIVANFWQTFGKISLVFGCIGTDL